MIPTGAMLEEYRRLVNEAAEVAYSRDEYLQLIFNAAVLLADGTWNVPKSRIITLEPRALPQSR